LLDLLVNRLKVTPPGVSDANASTSAFFAGHTGMVLSTGSLSFCARQHEDALSGRLQAAQCAQLRADWRRFVDPAQGQFSRASSRRLDVDQLADDPRDRRRAEPLYGIWIGRPLVRHLHTVDVRKAIEDQVQAILSGKTAPAGAVQAPQKNADELLRPYVEETALKRLA
jgi:sn-glycerol 3-phosphate transport system substrate-binding protein